MPDSGAEFESCDGDSMERGETMGDSDERLG